MLGQIPSELLHHQHDAVIYTVYMYCTYYGNVLCVLYIQICRTLTKSCALIPHMRVQTKLVIVLVGRAGRFRCAVTAGLRCRYGKTVSDSVMGVVMNTSIAISKFIMQWHAVLHTRVLYLHLLRAFEA